MKRKSQGTLQKSSLVGGEVYNTYITNPLPPNPPIEPAEIANWNKSAIDAINALNDIVSVSAPDSSILNYMYVRKEAVLSSQIEGTQSTLDDLLRYESEQAAGAPIEDAEEVSCYVAALNHGLKRIEGGFPLCLRLIREIHKILLESSRGRNKTPGKFRKSQNWIGGSRPGNARFVPPPPDKVPDLMSALEKFMYKKNIPPLIRAALMHQQFEADDAKVASLGRPRITASAVFTQFKQKPLLTIKEIVARTKLAKNTAISSVERLIGLGIIKNTSEKKWGQIYSYLGYLGLLNAGE
jgi:Fic family protein